MQQLFQQLSVAITFACLGLAGTTCLCCFAEMRHAGQARIEAGTHLVHPIGMIYMAALAAGLIRTIVPTGLLAISYALVGLVILACFLHGKNKASDWYYDGVNPSIECAAMAYMFLPTSWWNPFLTIVFIGYFLMSMGGAGHELLSRRAVIGSPAISSRSQFRHVGTMSLSVAMVLMLGSMQFLPAYGEICVSR